MSKIIRLVFVAIIVISGLLLASNPNSFKGYTSWMFEGAENNKVLPDLSNEEIEKTNAAEKASQKAAEPVVNKSEQPIEEIPAQDVSKE